MWIPFRNIALCLLLPLSAAAQAQAPDSLAGDWHGQIQTPQGSMALIVTLEINDQGEATGVLESPAQAPGVKIPMEDVQAGPKSLAFRIPSIAATYRGTWVEDENQWKGVFTQQFEFPLTLKRGTPPADAVIEGLDGTWRGTLRRNEVDLRLVLRVQTGERGTIATLDSPDLGAFNLPVNAFTRKGDDVSFEVPAASVRFEGQLADEGSTIHGQWSRPGQPSTTVRFLRTDMSTQRPAQARPQMPTEPLGYRVENVTFENPEAEGVTLAGTLTWPKGRGPFAAAVLISGSGPQDRDQSVFGHQPFAVLADHLTREGIAVLRVDDRGVGASTGSHGTATSADFASDANAAANYLLRRDGIAPDAVGFVGHSEGGMIAPLAAVENDRIAFIVMLAGPGTSTIQLMESQRRLISLSQGVSEAELERAAPVFSAINRTLMAAVDQADAEARVRAVLSPAALETLWFPSTQRETMVRQFSRAWYRYFLQYDPAAVLARVRVPVLALNGTLDLQVPADENLEAIAAALQSNPDATTIKLEGLNHMFQTTSTGAFGEYPDIAETFAPAALTAVSTWILARFPMR